MIVAVAGNPNSGKTTLYNALTGSRAHVGNYPGVTVERREAPLQLPNGTSVRLIDLPGCYSLIARSPEEEVAHQALIGAHHCPQPNVVVCVVDATQLARSLYLVLQIAELAIPMVIALNMMDATQAQGIQIDVATLAERLHMRVVPMSARMGDGLGDLTQAIADELRDPMSIAQGRATILDQLTQDDVECVMHVRAALAQRAATLNAPTQEAPKRELPHPTSHTSVGAAIWLLTSRWDNIYASHMITRGDACDSLLHQLRGTKHNDLSSPVRASLSRRVITARYAQVDALLDGVLPRDAQPVDKRTRLLDRVFLHPLWGMAIFILTMFVLFQAVFAWATPMMDGIEHGVGWLAENAGRLISWELGRSFIVNGLIAGIGNVLVFLPQIALLFLGLTLLEESGYMARAAFLMDRMMRRVGLHGTAFLPLLSSFACAVPGIMAARTIGSKRDRLMTILIAPFMSCSARLPVYTLVIAAVFASTPPVLGFLSMGGTLITAMYFLGFAAAIGTAWLLKRTALKGPPPVFMLEMPTYKMPQLSEVMRRVWERCRVFVSQTGRVIVCISMILWVLLTFPRLDRTTDTQVLPQSDAQHLAAEQLAHSFGGRIGHAIEPIIAPLGFDWRIGVGLVASFAAREVLVSALGQVYAIGADIDPDAPALRSALLSNVDPTTGRPHFTPLTGISLMVFFVLAMQCMSTVAAVRRETNSWGWAIAQLVYMNGLAYAASLLVYQGGRALGWH